MSQLSTIIKNSEKFSINSVLTLNTKSNAITNIRMPISMATVTTTAPIPIPMPSSTSTPTPAPASASTVSTIIMNSWLSQVDKEHPEISFVIPNHHDNQHIDKIMNFQQTLRQIDNNAIYDTIATTTAVTATKATIGQEHTNLPYKLSDTFIHPTITHEQISKSVVLDMTDIRQATFNGLERFFGNTDIHTIINYLWLAIVITLIVLSIIFIILSCYFYRKFRIWKKCNKDIRTNLVNDIYGGSTEPYQNNPNNSESIYYQMQSPPCYTIATGLPTYDEAIYCKQNQEKQQQQGQQEQQQKQHEDHYHHHQEYQRHQHHNQHQHQHNKNNHRVEHLEKSQQQSPSYTYGFKLIYPTLPFIHRKTSNIINTLYKYNVKEKERKTVKLYNVKPEVRHLQSQLLQQQQYEQYRQTNATLSDHTAAAISSSSSNSNSNSNHCSCTSVALLSDYTNNSEMDNATAQTASNVTEQFSTNHSDYEISNLYNLSDIISV